MPTTRPAPPLLLGSPTIRGPSRSKSCSPTCTDDSALTSAAAPDGLIPSARTTFADQTTALALAPGKRRDLDDVSGSWRRPDGTRLFPQGQPFTTAGLQLATPGAPDSIRIWHAPTPTPGARAIRDHVHQIAPDFPTPQPVPVAIQFTYDVRRLQWLGVIVSQPASAGTHQVNCWAIQTALTTDAPGAGTW
ncbi:hypothetical protein ACU686_03820 [Yinghuangia aomiensis]